jgi:osmotically-inducible protein OsmY
VYKEKCRYPRKKISAAALVRGLDGACGKLCSSPLHHKIKEATMSRMYATTIVLITIAMIGLASCQTAGQTPAQKAAKEAAYNARIVSEVKASLAEDKTTAGLPIGVESKGGSVTLTGTVQTETQKSRAGLIASGVEGCREVDNLLTVTK